MNIESYLKPYTEELSFIETKEPIKTLRGEVEIREGLPLPIWNDDLLQGIKSGSWEHEIKGTAIIDGIIAILGIDSEFKYNHEYLGILEAAFDEPAQIIKTRSLQYYKEERWIKLLLALRTLEIYEDYDEQAVLNLTSVYGQLFEAEQDDEAAMMLQREAIELLERYANEHGDTPKINSMLGEYYIDSQQYLKAKLTFLRGIRMTQEDDEVGDVLREQLERVEPDALFEMIWTRLQQGRAKEVAEEMEELLKRAGHKEKVKYLWARFLIQEQAYKEAAEVLTNLVEENEDTAYLSLLVETLYIMEDYKNALIYSEKLQRKPDVTLEMKINHGLIQYTAGERDEGIQTLKNVYRENPNSEIESLINQLERTN